MLPSRSTHIPIWPCSASGTSSFSSHSLVLWTLNQPRAAGERRANSEPQISSSCPRRENKWLFSWAKLPHFPFLISLSLHPSSIAPSPGAVAFLITGPLSSRACSLLLALTLHSLSIAFLPFHLSAGCSLTHTLAGHVSCLIPSTRPPPSPSLLGGSHQQTGAICLHVMEVWGCGARLGPSRPSGGGQPRQMPKHSLACVYVCVRTGAALSHCVRTGLTPKDMHTDWQS